MSYYDVLGVERTATGEEIQERYREQAQVLHPDHGGDTAAFQRLNEAYRTLSDPARRRAYDAGLPAARWSGSSPTRPSPPAPESEVIADAIPDWARDRWVTEDVETPRERSDRRVRERNDRDLRRMAWAAGGGAVGAAAGQLTSNPAAVALACALAAGVIGPLVTWFVRGGTD